jgi:hypothetical protein
VTEGGRAACERVGEVLAAAGVNLVPSTRRLSSVDAGQEREHQFLRAPGSPKNCGLLGVSVTQRQRIGFPPLEMS